jgi:hypothetical protein
MPVPKLTSLTHTATEGPTLEKMSGMCPPSRDPAWQRPARVHRQCARFFEGELQVTVLECRPKCSQACDIEVARKHHTRQSTVHIAVRATLVLATLLFCIHGGDSTPVNPISDCSGTQRTGDKCRCPAGDARLDRRCCKLWN